MVDDVQKLLEYMTDMLGNDQDNRSVTFSLENIVEIEDINRKIERLLGELKKKGAIEEYRFDEGDVVSVILNRTSENDTDTNNIVEQAKDIKQDFVQTEKYIEANNNLEKSSIIALIGKSGYGKTNSSILLAAEYYKEYAIHLIEGSDTELVDLREKIDSIKKNYSKKEIIIFDDFLGKTELNKESKYIDCVTDFLKYIANNSNKKIVLNSRRTIFENAKIQSNCFSKFIQSEVCIIELDGFEDIEEKCQIIASYIKKYNIQSEEVKLDNKQWYDILENPNFSPLIVKRVMHTCINNKDLYGVFMNMLNNPDDIWESEINALNNYSKMYLYILYSLSDTWAKIECVDKCFCDYIEKKGVKYEENVGKTKQRLVNLLKYDEHNRVTFCHPSIIDYLKKELSSEDVEEILRYATYFEQFERLDEKREKIKSLYNDMNSFFAFKVMPYTFVNSSLEFVNWIGLKFLEYMVRLHINVDKKIVEGILKDILDCGRLFLLHSADVVLEAMVSIDYDFPTIINNDTYMKELFSCLNYENIWCLLEMIYPKSEKTINFRSLKQYIQQEIIEKLNDAANDKVNECIRNNLFNYTKEYFDEMLEEEDFNYEDVSIEIVDNIWEENSISSIIYETKEALCIKHKISNYEDAINADCNDIDIDYDFVEDFIIDYAANEFC